MKKTFLSLMIIILFASLISAQTPSLKIEKTDKGSVIIKELTNPAIFEFEIENLGQSDIFEIYSLIGVSMSPKGKFEIPHGKTKIEVMAFPNKEIRENNNGFYNFEYQLKGRNSGIFRDTLLIKIIPLEEAIAVEGNPFYPSDDNASIIVKNTQNANLNNLRLKVSSQFFSRTETFSLAPKEQKEITVQLDKKNLEKLSAGPYIISAELEIENKETKIEGIIEYLEEEGTLTEKTSEGLIIKKEVVKKTNIGNTPQAMTVELERGIISRLFTINSPSPTKTERNGLTINYIWEETIQPGESLVVESTTNYTFPFIIIMLIILAGFLAKIYSQKAISLSKNVSFVNTKKGEFALKVKIRVKARKNVDKVQLIDTLPGVTKLFEKFGKHPDKIDKNTRRIFWNIDSLRKGEERAYSYIIYSNLNVIGRFELPSALVTFVHNGKIQQVSSNRAFFAKESS